MGESWRVASPRRFFVKKVFSFKSIKLATLVYIVETQERFLESFASCSDYLFVNMDEILKLLYREVDGALKAIKDSKQRFAVRF